MKHATFLIVLIVLASSCSTTPRSRDARTASTRAARRAVWIDAWNPGMHSPEECRATLADCRRAGFDTLIVEVRKIGDAYHRSDLEPRGLTPSGAETDFDPLAWFIENAGRRHGLRIEAWIVAQRLWKGEGQPRTGWPRHVLTAHPEWALVDAEGRTADADGQVFADPSDPEARAHLAAVAADIARRYDVDAVHLDYIRYPGGTWGVGGPGARRFAQSHGRAPEGPEDEKFLAWRAQQVTDSIREIRRAVRSKSPRMEITAATVCWGEPTADVTESRAWRETAQDWPAWLEAGLIDRLYPMLYKRESVATERASFRSWLRRFMSETNNGRIVVGLGGYLNENDETRSQKRAVKESGLKGFALFSARNPSRSRVQPNRP